MATDAIVHRVVVIEDDVNTRRHLTSAVREMEGLYLLGEAGTCAEAMPLLRQEPDIALIDLGLPDGSGLDLIRKRFFQRTRTQFLVITVFADEGHVIPALEVGACGYLMKDSAMPDIRELILQVLAGGSPISPLIARKLLSRFRVQNDAEGMVPLTEREFDVLNLMSRGFTSSEVAGHLGVSYHTVVAHVRNIYRKLEVSSRSEAIFEATRIGLLPR